MKLRNIIIFTIVFLCLTPVLIGVKIASDFTSEFSLNMVKDNLEALSKIAKLRVLQKLQQLKSTNATILSKPQLRQFIEQSKTLGPAEMARLKQAFVAASNAIPSVKEISLFNSKGKLVTTSRNTPQVTTFSVNYNKPFPQMKIVKDNQEGIYLESVTRVSGTNGTEVYLLITWYTDFLNEMVSDRSGLGLSGEWLLAQRDEQGQAQFIVPLKYDANAALNRIVSSDSTKVPIVNALMGNESMMSNAPDYRGETVIAFTRFIPELNWGLVAKINRAEVEGSVEKLKNQFYTLGAFIVILSVGAGFFISSLVASPLEKFVRHLDKITRGEFENYLPSGAWAEIRIMAEHFNGMIASLKEQSTNLEKTIAERTRELTEANGQLEEMCHRDSLTGLHNRRYLYERLSPEIARSKRTKSPLTIVLMDIDYFKRINDEWGHAHGDIVLRELSNLLIKSCRHSDVVARIGGEEFCIMLPDTSLKTASIFIERLRAEIESYQFEEFKESFRVTSSFGLVELKEEDSVESIISSADRALYSAKNQGRNRVVSS